MLQAAGGEPLVVWPAIAERMDASIAGGYGDKDMGAIVIPPTSVP